MQRVLTTCAVVVVLALAGCNNGKRYGRLIGFVINGQTGQRVNAFPNSGNLANLGNDSNATNQVFALVEGRFKRAEPCGQGDANSNNLIAADGCYRIEGVPVNTDIPVFAQFDGFERFHGSARIETVAASVDDLVDSDPQLIGNIMIWPLGFQVDYIIAVKADNRPIAEATVNCQADPGNNAFETDGDDFIEPESTTLETVRATTDASGVAVLSGAQLVNGADYDCVVFRTDDVSGRVVQTDFSFTAGVDSPNIPVYLNVSGNGDALYAVRANNDNTEALMGVGANLVIFLNAPAQFYPGTEDCQRLALSTGDTDGDTQVATLVGEVLDNGVSETITATLSADGLTLTAAAKPLATAFDTGDLGTSISFNGIWIRPVDPQQHQQAFVIGSSNPNGSDSCSLAQTWDWDNLSNDYVGGTQNNQLDLF